MRAPPRAFSFRLGARIAAGQAVAILGGIAAGWRRGGPMKR